MWITASQEHVQINRTTISEDLYPADGRQINFEHDLYKQLLLVTNTLHWSHKIISAALLIYNTNDISLSNRLNWAHTLASLHGIKPLYSSRWKVSYNAAEHSECLEYIPKLSGMSCRSDVRSLLWFAFI